MNSSTNTDLNGQAPTPTIKLIRVTHRAEHGDAACFVLNPAAYDDAFADSPDHASLEVAAVEVPWGSREHLMAFLNSRDHEQTLVVGA